MAQAYPKPQQGQAKSREEGGKNAPAGLWVHPETGNSAITVEDPLFGNAQSQAFLQAGFVFEREVDPSEIVTLPQLALEKQGNDREQLKGLSARLSALENVSEENAVLQARVKQLEAEAAARNGDPATVARDGHVQKAEGVVTPSEKPLNKQNSSELKATAEAEGVDVTGADTNKKLAAAIQAARDAKESEK